LLLEFSPAANESQKRKDSAIWILMVVGENSNNNNFLGFSWLLERTPTTTRGNIIREISG